MYVKAGTNKIQLDAVDHAEEYISATKVDTEKGSTKSANITTENLRMFVNKVVENKPLHMRICLEWFRKCPFCMGGFICSHIRILHAFLKRKKTLGMDSDPSSPSRKNNGFNKRVT